MKKILAAFTILYGIISNPVVAQVSVNNSAAAPAASSMLDVSSTSKGVLLPRMTATERKAIANPAVGLLVFDTDRQTICLFDGQEWRPLVTTTENTPSIIQRTGTGSKPQGQFGKAVAMHGNYAVVGAPKDSVSGCVYVFVKEGGAWKQQAKLVASYMGSMDDFGASVDIHNDIIVVGAPGMKVGANNKQGRAYVFKRNGNNWQQVIGLQANNGQADDAFGSSVAVYENTIAVGAPYRDQSNTANTGAVYIVRNTSGTWEHRISVFASEIYAQANSFFGAALDLNDKTLLVGAPGGIISAGQACGVAYTFTNNDVLGYSWSSAQKFEPDHLPSYGKLYGASVALGTSNMIIGMPEYTFYEQGEDGGMWYTYTRAPNNGPFYKTLGVGSFKAYTREGSSVAVDGDTFYIGSEGWVETDGLPAYKGRVLVVKNNQVRYIYNVDRDSYGYFGAAVAADNGQYIIGAPHSNSNAIGTVSFGFNLQ